jgi:urease accessory protein
MASLFFVAGTPLTRDRRELALELARQVISEHELRLTAGATCPNPQVIVVRVLSPLVEPTVNLLRQVWTRWREHFWQLPVISPRIWAT